MIDYGALFDGSLLSELYSVLGIAAGWASTDMAEMLFHCSAQLDCSGALIWATERGRIKVVRFLLGHGAKINTLLADVYCSHQRVDIKATALHLAASKGHLNAVTALLDTRTDTFYRIRPSERLR